MFPEQPIGYKISIHALREEGDKLCFVLPTRLADFYPRPPRGGRHNSFRFTAIPLTDFYPRPPRGGRPPALWYTRRAYRISIHALREEGDIISWGVNKLLGGFLSTPSARRATSSLNTDTGGAGNFYPRPPRGGRRRGESR